MTARDTDLGRLAAYSRVKALAGKKNVTPAEIAKTRQLIEEDIRKFEALAGKRGG